MKKLLKLFLIGLLLFIVSACTREENTITYEIEINEELPTTIEVGSSIDFKNYFRIIASNDEEVEVTSEMLDLTEVDLNNVGKFKITIKYLELEKTLEFTVISPEDSEDAEDDEEDFDEDEDENDDENQNDNNDAEDQDQNEDEDEENELNNATELFISEYSEGKSYNKYIEIFNGTGKIVDLSNYSLALFNNSKQPAQYTFQLSGELKDGEIIIVYNPSANATIKENGNFSNRVIEFNGNDVIALLKGEEIIDVVGDLNNPVSDGWDIGSISEATKDNTIIRKSNVYSPNSNWNPDEWQVLGLEDYSDLKSHTLDNYEPVEYEDDENNDNEEKERVVDLFISEYFEGVGEYKDSKYIEIYNPFDTIVDLSNYALAVYKDGSLNPAFTEPLSGELRANQVYIVYAPYSVKAISEKGHLASEVCYFNGDDAIALLKDNEVIDVIGVIGEKPTDGWAVDDFSTTQNNTLIRKESINSPTSTWDPNEWYPCYENYLYDLGNHYQEEYLYNNFDLIFKMMNDLTLDSKGTVTSIYPIKVKGTVYMDVANETKLVFLTDGKNFIKLHGDKIHNYTAPGQVYEITAYYKVHQYIPSLEVENPESDIIRVDGEIVIDEIQVKEVELSEILALKRENFRYNLENGYLQSFLKVKGYLQYDREYYALTENIVEPKNDGNFLKSALYFKNNMFEFKDNLMDYEVGFGAEIKIEIYGVIYDWNPDRKNWRIYVDVEKTLSNLN